MNIKKRLLALLVAIPFLAIMITGMTAPAASAGDNAYTGTKFLSVDYDMIKMCHNWATNTCSSTSGNKKFIWKNSSYYRCTSTNLNACGSNAFNWNDSDGFYLPSGWKAATNVMGIPTGWVHYGLWDGYWNKVGDCGCWKYIKRYPK
jgi:hypothetical protein